MNKTIHVAICDHCSVIRCGLKHILNSDPNIDTTAEVYSFSEMLTNFARINPDVIMIDLEQNKRTELDDLCQFHELKPNVKIIIFTANNDKMLILEAIKMGVHGYLLKQAKFEEIINAIHVVYKGGTSFDTCVTTTLLQHLQYKQEQLQANLSKREQDVLDLIALGKTNNDIANTLYISTYTVKFHVRSILAKLNVRNRTEAAIWCK